MCDTSHLHSEINNTSRDTMASVASLSAEYQLPSKATIVPTPLSEQSDVHRLRGVAAYIHYGTWFVAANPLREVL